MNSSRLRHPLAQIVFIVLGGLTSISGHAMPTGAEVVHGQAVFNRIGQELRVENSRNAIIEWQDFSVELKESLRFVQPDELSAVLNRVVGSSPSEILGQISSNGRVFIVNPNGVLFGSESRIDVNGLIVSSLDIANDDFLEGRLKFERHGAAGAVINEGQLVSGEDTSIVLIAPVIENSGLVRSENGDIILAAGNSVELVDSQNPEIRVQISAPAGEALNLGTLISNGGSIGIYAGVIDQSGVVSASSAVAEGGKIYLRGRQQAVMGSESVTQADGSKGGRVVITADAVEVKSDAKISAVGANDGGEVLVGGSWQNSDPDVPQAKTVNVESGAELNASASDNGDGGTVVVWSDTSDAGSQTQVRGQLKAQGGASGGNGGRIEASGNQLDIEGMTASTEAPVGRQGQVLLDPTNITIFTATSNINGDGVFGDDIDNVNALDDFTDFSGADSTITGQALANLLDNNDVTLAATNNINVSAAIIKSGTPSTTLRLEAGNEVNLSGSISSTGGPLNLEFAPGLLLADGLVDVNSSTIDLAGGTLEVIDGSGLLYLSVPDAASHLTLNSTANVKHLHINGGVLDGSGTLNVSDTFKWSSGDMVGTGRTVIQAGASGSFGDASSMYLRESRVLDNRGDVVQSTNSLLGQAPFGGVTGATSTPLIYNSGTWELSGGTSITEGTADTFGFINTGTVIKTGSGTTSTLMDMTNNGTVQVSVGRLLLDQSYGTGRTHSGSFELGGAGNLTFFGGGHSFADGSAFSGSGVFQREAGSTLSLAGSGSGLTIDNGTGVNLALMNFQGTGSLTNRGLLTASAPFTFSGDILNTGVVTLTNDSTFNGLFNNQGTLNLNAGDASFATGLSVNGGTLNVSSGATLGGNVSLAGGILKGTGTLADDLIHTGGALRPGVSPGTLTISGDYQMSPSATLQIEVGGTTAGNYDQLDISGTATLDGVLEIVHFGGFVPVPITLFSSIIDAAGGVSGSFSSLIEPSGHRYDVVYNGSTVDLSYGRLLTITATDVSRDYGDSNPAFSATYAGLFSGDSGSDITGLTFTTAADNLSPVGDYQLTPSGGTAPVYYQLAYTDGTLAVVPRALTISADAQSKVYGDTLALGTSAFTANNLANGETVGSVTLTSLGGHDADTTSAVGIYAGDIQASNASGGTFDAGNYTLTYVDADLSVTPRDLTIAADAQSKVYGDTLALGTSAFTANNLANGETVGSVTLTSLGGHDSDTTSAVGSYTGDIQASNASGGTFDAGNYTLTYVDADLSVTPRAATITADAQSKVYGDTLALGTSAFTASNLANGEMVGSVTLTSLGGHDADTTSAVGTYTGDIQASNASGGTFDAANYTLTYVDGDLSVTPRAATITADAQSKVYGDTLALGTSAFTASNLANGETVGSVILTSLGGHDADTTSAVGSYTGDIQASNASGGTFDAGNYTLTYVDADLSVTPRDLTIAADAQSKVYGDTLTLGTSAFTANNLANGETVGSVTLTSLGGHDADITSAVGTYTGDIQASNASGGTFDAGNYTLTYVDADLSVTPRDLTITADAQNKVYGDALALGTSAFTVSNLANDETVESVTLTSLGGHDADTTSAVGTYTGDIQASNASGGTFDAGNYTLTYVDADLSVTPRDLTITADAQNKVYGDTLALGTSAFTANNLANGETVGSVTLTSLGGHDADTTSAVGTYTGDIQASNASGGTFDAGNYTLTYVDADLSVTPRDLTITADAQNKVYGDTLALGTSAFTVSNLANDETVESVTLTSLGGHDADTTTPVGTYMSDIQVSDASGGTFDPANYTLTYVDGDLTVNPSTLVINVDAKAKAYRREDPLLTFQVAEGNLANDDRFVGELTREVGELPGLYRIDQGSLRVNENYDYVFNPNYLEVVATPELEFLSQLISLVNDSIVGVWTLPDVGELPRQSLPGDDPRIGLFDALLQAVQGGKLNGGSNEQTRLMCP